MTYTHQDLLKTAILSAWKAGKAIMEIYDTEFSFEWKDDKSPLTEADLRSHNVIKAALELTGYPVLSEEGKTIPYADRNNWEMFWLVDPLDGTKEFIKRNGEFTVNIAFINKGIPELGVIYVPVTKKLYFGLKEAGSFTFDAGEDVEQNLVEYISGGSRLPASTLRSEYTIVSSRTHSSPETEAFISQKSSQHGNVNLINAGSSLKLCLVAEGKADVYPRLAPTMEWDTAAGDAIVRCAGGRVYDYETKQDLRYNKENLLNPFFVAEIANNNE